MPPKPAPTQPSRAASKDASTTAKSPVPAGSLNRSAYPLGPVNLDIPEARLPTVQGRLVMKLWINEQGQVVAFEAEPTDLPTEYVTAVGDTLTEVRFAPALKQGRPVASVLRIEVDTEAVDAPR